MHVVMVTASSYPHVGGLSSHLDVLSRTLAEAGHEVDVYGINASPALLRRAVYSIPTALLNRLSPPLATWYSAEIRARLLARVLRKLPRKPDVINAQDVIACRAARAAWPSTPVVMTVHGYLVYENISEGLLAPQSPLTKRLLDFEGKAYSGADYVVCVDSRIASHVKSLGAKAQRIEVIHNFVDIARFAPATPEQRAASREKWNTGNKIVIVCCRRLVAKNGVLFLVRALRHLKDPERFCVLIAGSGPQRQVITEVVADLTGVDVRMLGAVPYSEIADLYSSADIAVVPSVPSGGVEEATSIAALEAMSCGLPTIASSIGGLREIISDRVDGVLVRPNDDVALASAIQQLADNPALRQEMGFAARKRILANHERRVVAEKYLRIYERALEVSAR